ncbi:secreted RxLR effector protein 161-like [Nicotiana tabacum]|uniref:Secreted RxLR effector protein 161-like n=1 Tax=Nicotiana tabacum TaxID=4097 RepID=A0A1S3YHH7_TOBAC|nr:PREDICTED: uncharacterized mitochondrial protein AtMg00810-like [Nicotiana tabacum]
MERYKTRLVAQCYNQQEGLDYIETFSPVAKMVTVRVVVALAAASSEKPVCTPLEFNHKLTFVDFDQEVNKNAYADILVEDKGIYQILIGRLLYLTMTRPDITFVVQLLSQYMHTPKVSHMEAAKRVIRYIKSTPELGLFMPTGSYNQLVAYCDSEWVAYVESRRSVSGYVVKFGGALISWKSKN